MVSWNGRDADRFSVAEIHAFPSVLSVLIVAAADGMARIPLREIERRLTLFSSSSQLLLVQPLHRQHHPGNLDDLWRQRLWRQQVHEPALELGNEFFHVLRCLTRPLSHG